MDDESPLTVSLFSAEDTASHLGALGALLHACVQAGASIGFVLPFAAEESEAFWREKVLPEVRQSTRAPVADAEKRRYPLALTMTGQSARPYAQLPSLPVEPGIHRHSRDLGRGIEM